MCFEDLWRVIPSCHYTEEGNNDSSKRRNNAEVCKYLYRFLRKCSDCKRECKSKSYKYIRYSMSSISSVEILFCFFKHLYRVQYKSYHNFLFLRFDITNHFHLIRGLLLGLTGLLFVGTILLSVIVFVHPGVSLLRVSVFVNFTIVYRSDKTILFLLVLLLVLYFVLRKDYLSLH